MQTLFIKTKNAEGKSSERKVQVIRSWQDSGGRQIYLHANGVHGYKDGSPVKSTTEFDLIADPVQKRAALSWWKRAGGAMSDKYYTDLERAMEEKQASEIPSVVGDLSELDAVQYIRRPVNDRRKVAFSEPHTWMEWFEHRPEWWGYATVIELGNFRYQRMEEDTPGDDDNKEDDFEGL